MWPHPFPANVALRKLRKQTISGPHCKRELLESSKTFLSFFIWLSHCRPRIQSSKRMRSVRKKVCNMHEGSSSPISREVPLPQNTHNVVPNIKISNIFSLPSLSFLFLLVSFVASSTRGQQLNFSLWLLRHLFYRKTKFTVWRHF